MIFFQPKCPVGINLKFQGSLRINSRSIIAAALFSVLFLLGGCTVAQRNIVNEPINPELVNKFSFPANTEHILLPVAFQGNEYLFCLDTGAAYTVFDISLKDNLPQPSIGTEMARDGDGALFKIEKFRAPQAYLGNLSLSSCIEVFVLNLDMVDKMTGKQVHGLIGMDFLKDYIIQIDFADHTVSFIKPVKNINRSQWGEPIPIKKKFRSNKLYVRGKVENNPVDFWIDTGFLSNFFGGTLESNVIDKIDPKFLIEIPHEKTTVVSDSSSESAKVISTNNFKIGRFEYSMAVFSEHKESILGLRFLRRHTVTFDFPDKKMYLKAASNSARESSPSAKTEFVVPGFEFTLAIGQDGVFVKSIDEKGGAYEKGIRAKDILLKFNDHDVNSYNLQQFSDFLVSFLVQKNFDHLTITIKRDGETKEIIFLRSGEPVS